MDVSKIYANILTDEQLEKVGIWRDVNEFIRIKIARSGGANKSFARLLEAKSKPYQRAIKTDTMDTAIAERIMREVYAEAVVIGWQTKDGDEWKDIILFKDGSTANFSKAAVIRALEEFNDILIFVQDEATKASNFLQAQRDANAGN